MATNVFERVVEVKTRKKIELVDITVELSQAVRQSSISSGLASFFAPHTTAALIINENEPRLVNDIEQALHQLIPWDRHYDHNLIDNNAPAHIAGAFVGGTLSVPLSTGRLDLGTWQSIFFVEMDGPRHRRVKVTILGE